MTEAGSWVVGSSGNTGASASEKVTWSASAGNQPCTAERVSTYRQSPLAFAPSTAASSPCFAVPTWLKDSAGPWRTGASSAVTMAAAVGGYPPLRSVTCSINSPTSPLNVRLSSAAEAGFATLAALASDDRGVGVFVGAKVILGNGVGDASTGVSCGVGQLAASSGCTVSACSSAPTPGTTLHPIVAKVKAKIRTMTKDHFSRFMVSSHSIG